MKNDLKGKGNDLKGDYLKGDYLKGDDLKGDYYYHNMDYQNKLNNKIFDAKFKFVLIGDTSVGKTSILSQYTDNIFPEYFLSTIGVDYKSKNLEINDLMYKLLIYDCAGQARFKNITSLYFRNMDGILLIYDITDITSFENIDIWMEEISNHYKVLPPMILVGNKSELTSNRQVSFESGMEMAKKYNIQFLEVSAKTGNNIKNMFNLLTNSCIIEKSKDPISLNNNKYLDNNNNINLKNPEKPKASCCVIL